VDLHIKYFSGEGQLKTSFTAETQRRGENQSQNRKILPLMTLI
jgi:hypothetical protein